MPFWIRPRLIPPVHTTVPLTVALNVATSVLTHSNGTLTVGITTLPGAWILSTSPAVTWWLWLEDTDDAMTCVRGVLEQTCRARAHRVKPARAARIEDIGPAASTARWLEAAGWRRLAVLGRALGEFAHISFRARWSGARDALAALQADDIPHPNSTARRHALEASAYLLAHEVAARFDAACPAVGATFRARVTQLGADEHERQVEELLQRSLKLRSAEFGQPDLSPLPASAPVDEATLKSLGRVSGVPT